MRELNRREFIRATSALAALGKVAPLLSPATAAAAGPTPGSADWVRYGYDLHNTRFNAKESVIGPSNVAKLKVKWKFDMEDNWIGYQTPAVIGDTAYFGSGRYQYAIESATGKKKWSFDWGAGGEWEQANATAVSARFWGARSSPQFYNGRLYFGASSCNVYCVDAATGKQIWKTPLLDAKRAEYMGAQIFYSPVVYADRVFIAYSGGDASIFCLDADTGAIRWRFRVAQDVPEELEAGGGSPWTSGAIDEKRGILYNVTGNAKAVMPNLGLYTACIVAHDLETGELLWYYQVHPQDDFDLDFNAHPIIYDSEPPQRIRGNPRNFVAAGNKAGIYCWDRYTGEYMWKVMLGMICAGCGPEYNAIAAAYNRIYVQWSSSSSPKPFSASAALNGYTGEVEWMVTNPLTNSSPVAVANGLFYQGFLNGRIEAVDAKIGRTLWDFTLPSAFRGGFAVANGALYASNGEGGAWNPSERTKQYSLYCFTPDGK